MPFPLLVPLAIAAGSAIAGGLSNTKAARTSTAMPTVSPEYKTLGDLLRSRAEERLRSTIDMRGYEANGISNINDAFGGISQTLNNNLTSRGLGTSPVAGAVDANTQMARGGNIAQFLNTIPQLQRQMQSDDMTQAMNIFQQGLGQTNVGAGSALGSAFGSGAEMLAFLHGKGAFGGGGPTQTTGTGIPRIGRNA